MGIMGLKLQPLVSFDTIPWREIRGKRLAIDGSNMLFQLLYNPIQRQRSETMYVDKTGRVISHLYGWLQKISQFHKHRLSPVVVFDGVPNALKRSYSAYRYQNYVQMAAQYQDALKNHDWHMAKTIGLDPRFFWPNCVHESKAILEDCGIPVIMAPEEAEAQCVALQKQGLVEYVVTQDLDVLVYGATKVIRQLTFKTQKLRAGKWQSVQPGLISYNGKTIRNMLHLTPFEFIDLSILLGNDYFAGIAQIGPQTALKTMHYYHSLENIQAKHSHLISGLSANTISTIRRIFMCPNVTTFSSLPKVGEDFGSVRNLLLQDHSLNEEKVTQMLQRMHTLKDHPAKLTADGKSHPEDDGDDDLDNENNEGYDPTRFNPNDFTAALHLPKNKEADKKERQESNLVSGKGLSILPKILNVDELRQKGIDGYMRFEIFFERHDLEVYYVKKNDPIELWPYNVQLQFVVLVDILHNLCMIPDRIYREKYEPMIARVENAEAMLQELKFICDNMLCNS